MRIGLAITIGFVVMILVDEIVARIFKKSKADSTINSVIVKVTTAGMCIHSAAEGLSIGGTLFCKPFLFILACSELIWSQFNCLNCCHRTANAQST